MRKLIIDLSGIQPVNGTKFNGGGLYAEKMLYLLHERYGSDRIVCLFDGQKGECERLDIFTEKNDIEKYAYTNFDDLSKFINTHSNEVFFFPICFPNFHELRIEHKPTIIATIHDLSTVYELCTKPTEEKLIDHSRVKEFLKFSILHSFVLGRHVDRHKKICKLSENEVIITDSEYSKQQMLKWLDIKNPEDIHVFYPLLFDKEDENLNMKSKEMRELESNKFLFFVSANRWHKNNLFAVKAIDEAISNGNEYLKTLKYVVTGHNDISKSYYNSVIKNKEYFILRDFTSREEYDYLMSNALAMVYPSLFEGFGAPPIEAMRNRTVPLCSNESCIPEISGDAAIYFDPRDKNDFIEAVMKTKDSVLMREYKKKGKDRYDQIIKRQDEDIEKVMNLFDTYL